MNLSWTTKETYFSVNRDDKESPIWDSLRKFYVLLCFEFVVPNFLWNKNEYLKFLPFTGKANSCSTQRKEFDIVWKTYFAIKWHKLTWKNHNPFVPLNERKEWIMAWKERNFLKRKILEIIFENKINFKNFKLNSFLNFQFQSPS